MEFHTTGRYDLMYMKTKELGWKETQGIEILASNNPRGTE
jgi:hypothetical protein